MFKAPAIGSHFVFEIINLF